MSYSGLLLLCAALPLLQACVSKEEASAQLATIRENNRQPFVAEIEAVSRHVRAEHLESCRQQIEGMQHLLGGPWRLTRPLQPSLKWTCMESGTVFGAQGSKQVAGYLAPAVAGNFKQAMGCLMTLENGQLSVVQRIPPTTVAVTNRCRAMP
jgi:hypothetical protein